MNIRKSIAGLLVLFLVGCGDSPTGPDPAPECVVSSVSISPQSATLDTGETQQFTADVTFSSGQNCDRSVTWTNENPNSGSVSSSGLYTAENPGSDKVIAKSSANSSEYAEAEITIEEPEEAGFGTAFLVFSRGSNVALMDDDGDVKILDWVKDEYGDMAVWFPTGDRLVLGSLKSGEPRFYSVRLDGSQATELTPGGFYTVGEPAVSPDGNWIAFEGQKTSTGPIEIYKSNINTGELVQLTDEDQTSRTPGEPTWSPGGSKISFRTFRDGNYEIYVMDADGTNKENVSQMPDSEEISPDWSPDGNRIAFQSSSEGPGGNNAWEIWVMSPDGSEKAQLTNNSVRDFNPTWSPDGSEIAFERHLDSNTLEIFRMNSDGSDQTNLTNGESGVNPDWRP